MSKKPRKPTALLLKERGKIYPGQFSPRGNEPEASGEPIIPDWLTGDVELAYWHTVVPRLVALGVAKEADSDFLGQLCQQHARSQDTNLSVVQRGHASDRFIKIGKLFGMSPSDRASLSVPNPTKKGSGIQDLIA